MQFKFTPGPYSISDLAMELKCPTAEAGGVWKDGPGFSIPLAVVDRAPGDEQAAANLRLFGTAPETFTALVKMAIAWRNLAAATGEEGLLKEDEIYNMALIAIARYDKQLAEDIKEGRQNHD
jgi:hypothetical protein